MTSQFGWRDHFEQRSDILLSQQCDERITLIQHAEQYGLLFATEVKPALA